MLDRHTAVSLLRVYAGAAVQHALRGAIVSTDEAMKYDEQVARSWSTLLHTCITAREERLWLPARLGGLGALSARTRAAPAAWASWVAVTHDLMGHFSSPSVHGLLSVTPVVQHLIAGLHVRVAEQGWPAYFASMGYERALLQPAKTSMLMGYVHKKTCLQLTSGMTTRQFAMFRSMRGPGAAAFLEAPLDEICDTE